MRDAPRASRVCKKGGIVATISFVMAAAVVAFSVYAKRPVPSRGGIDLLVQESAAAAAVAARDWYAIEAAAVTGSSRGYLSHDTKTAVHLFRWPHESAEITGGQQQWRITLVEKDVYNIEAAAVTDSGRTFLSHDGVDSVDLWSDPGGNQGWRIQKAPDSDAFVIEAAEGVGDKKYLSHNGVKSVDLWSHAGSHQSWRIHGFSLDSVKKFHAPISPGECADPFVWNGGHRYHMICTGGQLAHYTGSDIKERFSPAGHVLPHSPDPSWSLDGHRWAPETIQVGPDNFVFFSAPSYGEHLKPHRIGWARAANSSGSDGAWNRYAKNATAWFDGFPKSKGGEIDPSIYMEVDEYGSQFYYLLWKTDDNNAGDLTTRLWMQSITFDGSMPKLEGAAKMLLDSSGLWWVSSFTPGGALIEGPEIIKHGGYYYLFFAAGRYCKADYVEGVARSTSLWGPFESSPLPVISTGQVGHVHYKGGTPKLVGPGHAGFFKQDGTWYMVWHASPGYNCERHAFVSALEWHEDWPRLAQA